MKTEIIDAKPHHCGQIARRLRKAHDDILTKMGISAHADLRARFDASPAYRKAWLADGKLMGVAGVDGDLSSSEGFIWLALAEGISGARFARAALAEFERLFNVRQRISTFILKDDLDSLRFAYFLGFRVESTETRHGVAVLTMVADRQMRKVA